MRAILGIGLIVFYVAWVVYRAFVKRDMKAHKDELYLFSFFMLIWIGIYAASLYS